MSQEVFTYGSNMCSGRFRDYGVSPEGRGRAAVLGGHRLVFNKRSTDDGSGKANVEVSEGSDVWGVLYRISDADLEKLTKGEGGYHPVRLQVQVVQDTPCEMWIYLAKKPNTSLRLRPYTWYKRFLTEGAREHCLPAEYIAFLEGIEAIEDADRERDKRKRALACQA